MGRATAHLFADQGAKVAVTDITTSGVNRVVADITAAGGTATGWRLDVSDDDEVARVVEGWGATRFASPYTVAKHGVVGLTKSLAVELGPEQITVNCVCPGPIDIAMTASIPDDDKVVFAKRRTALGRYGSAEEVAHATLNFALPSASYMTGCILPVDGGLLVKNA